MKIEDAVMQKRAAADTVETRDLLLSSVTHVGVVRLSGGLVKGGRLRDCRSKVAVGGVAHGAL